MTLLEIFGTPRSDSAPGEFYPAFPPSLRPCLGTAYNNAFRILHYIPTNVL